MANKRIYNFPDIGSTTRTGMKVMVDSQATGARSVDLGGFGTTENEGVLQETIAAEFSASASYAIGDLCTYNLKLYKFTSAHSGEWSASDVTEITVTGAIDAVDTRLSAGISSVSGGLASEITARGTSEAAIKANIATTFDASTSYGAGAFVLYNGTLYKFTTAHEAGAWTGTDVTQTDIADELEGETNTRKSQTSQLGTNLSAEALARQNADTAIKAMVADDFDASEVYASGTYCIYNNVLYQFTAEHSGAWTGTDVTAVVTMNKLSSVENRISQEASARVTNDNVIKANIATTFSASTDYDVGAFVLYSGTLYKFTAAHTAGAWTGTDVTQTDLADELEGETNTRKAQTSQLGTNLSAEALARQNADTAIKAIAANTFSAASSYSVDDLVIYNNVLYKFTAAHSGAWTGTDVTATNLAAEIASGGGGGGTSDHKVLINASDTAPGYLAAKLVEGDNIELTVQSDNTIKISSPSDIDDFATPHLSQLVTKESLLASQSDKYSVMGHMFEVQAEYDFEAGTNLFEWVVANAPSGATIKGRFAMFELDTTNSQLNLLYYSSAFNENDWTQLGFKHIPGEGGYYGAKLKPGKKYYACVFLNTTSNSCGTLGNTAQAFGMMTSGTPLVIAKNDVGLVDDENNSFMSLYSTISLAILAEGTFRPYIRIYHS